MKLFFAVSVLSAIPSGGKISGKSRGAIPILLTVYGFVDSISSIANAA